MENWSKWTYSPTIRHFQHFLMETTPILSMRRSTLTQVYDQVDITFIWSQLFFNGIIETVFGIMTYRIALVDFGVYNFVNYSVFECL